MNASRLLNEIRAQFHEESLVRSCSGEGCTVDMNGVPAKRVIVNLETEFDWRKKREKRCDRLLFFTAQDTLVAAAIELKSGGASESAVIAQLESSLHFINRDIVPVSLQSQIEYVLVLFHGGRMKWTSPKKKQQQLEVFFGGTRLPVQTGRCGRPRNLAGLLFKKRR